MAEPTSEKPRPEIEEIVDELKSYINTYMDLYKMKATEKGAVMASNAIINLVMAVLVVIIFLFVSFALAFCLSEYFDNLYAGFLIIAGFYTLLAVIIYLSKDKWLKTSLVNNIIKSVYSH